MARTSIDQFDDLMIYLGQTLIRMRDDATTVTTLTADAEAQLDRMDPDAAEVLTHEHFVAQLLALTRALPLEQMNAYVERLLNPENPFHGVIGTAARESVAAERHAH